MKSLIKSCASAILNSRIGYRVIRTIILATQYRVFSARTVHLMNFDAERLKARTVSRNKKIKPSNTRLQIACGNRPVPGWTNTDVNTGDIHADLVSGSLPWVSDSFDTVVGQHVIEHLALNTELIPLFRELNRVMKTGGQIWLSCPDMEKACQGYVNDKGLSLMEHAKERKTEFDGLGSIPTQHFINLMFHQRGEHKNLFDFELLSWALQQGGFKNCEKITEANLLEAHSDFPPRNDDQHTLYVTATAG